MSRENENEFQIKSFIFQYKILKNKACIFILCIKQKDQADINNFHINNNALSRVNQ